MKSKIICIAAAIAAAGAITAVAVAQSGGDELGEPEILSSVESVDSTDNGVSADIEDSESETLESAVDSDNETAEPDEEESVDAPESKPAYHEGFITAVDPFDSSLVYKFDLSLNDIGTLHWTGNPDFLEESELGGESSEVSLEYLKDFFGTDNLPFDDQFKSGLMRNPYKGDFLCYVSEGAEAYSPVEGRVVATPSPDIWYTWYNAGLGALVAVEFDDGKIFIITHLDEIYVEVGDTVSAGQALGVCGHSGKVLVEDPPLMRLIPMIVED